MYNLEGSGKFPVFIRTASSSGRYYYNFGDVLDSICDLYQSRSSRHEIPMVFRVEKRLCVCFPKMKDLCGFFIPTVRFIFGWLSCRKYFPRGNCSFSLTFFGLFLEQLFMNTSMRNECSACQSNQKKQRYSQAQSVLI